MQSIKCPLCTNKYLNKGALYAHMTDLHEEQLNGLSPAHYYFNFKNKKTHGKCIVDGKETKFNEATEKYDRICSERCRKIYREQFKKRMVGKYGKEHLLNDPDVQKKMLSNRKISGEYEWSDGTKFTYTGTYEKDFLEFLDTFLGLESTDVMCPAPQIIQYTHEGKDHFYIPDVYIQSLNLIIEIKASDNNHYRSRDIDQEKSKDKAVAKTDFKYFKVFDKKYDDFFNFLISLKNE